MRNDEFESNICFCWCLWNPEDLLGALYLACFENWHCLTVWGTLIQIRSLTFEFHGPYGIEKEANSSLWLNKPWCHSEIASFFLQKVKYCASSKCVKLYEKLTDMGGRWTSVCLSKAVFIFSEQKYSTLSSTKGNIVNQKSHTLWYWLKLVAISIMQGCPEVMAAS